MVKGPRSAIRRPRVLRRQKKLRVHLIDALPYVFRAYYALPSSIRDPRGKQCNAVVGFANFLYRYIADEKPTHVAVCFDRSLTSSFRNKLYPDYKSNRGLPDTQLKAQIECCQKLAKGMGLACFADKSYEADDLIGSFAQPLAKLGHTCVVVSCDKDLCQLVGPRVTMYDYAKGERLDKVAVRKKMGVDPEQIPDYLGLAGDPVDSIPGVRGLGQKTAIALLGKFRSLEAVYDNLDKVARMSLRGAQGIADKLAEQKEAAFLSRKLATVVCHLPRPSGGLGALKRCKPTASQRWLANVGLSRMHDRLQALPAVEGKDN
eukprot:TRINITY_DN64941_c0_g1_i1.p1 TRINITY_DN64941_c0_g1~~TRINITY_DN64941_c0_g1_i1.p1  ORF type:complete len:329 (+),score=43.89 TRINITY_DN64941_c0_g1_i1:36-989(+)